jgi:Tfp pilus assembly protein PilO
MTNDTRTIAIVALAGIAILAGLWMLAISPKREERTQVKANLAGQQARLQTAQTELASFEAAKKQFPVKLAELKQLDKAVPSRGAISSLLRQLQRRAKVRHSNLRLVALKPAGAAPAAPGAAGTTPAPPVTPGASVGPDGLAALPFTFEFTGEYFDLRDILATVRRSVSVKKDKVKVGGRLLTIDGLSFTRMDPESSQTKATLNATAYIAPDGASTPQPPAAANATTPPVVPTGGK